MNDTEKLQQVREAIALIINQGGSHQNEWTKTNAILSLSSIGVISDEQEPPSTWSASYGERKGSYEYQKDILNAGFVRLIKKEK